MAFIVLVSSSAVDHAPVFGAPAIDPRFRISQFTTEHGLPQNTVEALLQTRDGYIWIGTRAGLVRYDGMRFRAFTRELEFLSSPGVRIRDLFEDSAGQLWIRVNDDGLIRWSSPQPKFFSMRELLPAGDGIHPVIARRGGGIWIGSSTDYASSKMAGSRASGQKANWDCVA